MLQDDRPALSFTVCQIVRYQLVVFLQVLVVPSAHDPWLTTLFLIYLLAYLCFVGYLIGCHIMALLKQQSQASARL